MSIIIGIIICVIAICITITLVLTDKQSKLIKKATIERDAELIKLRAQIEILEKERWQELRCLIDKKLKELK